MNNKSLPDDFHEDLQWEIEADKAWGEFYQSYGINRSELIRQMTTPIHKSLWNIIKGRLWCVYYRFFPSKYER